MLTSSYLEKGRAGAEKWRKTGSGVLLANAIGGMFAGSAQADEMPEEEPDLGEDDFADDSEW